MNPLTLPPRPSPPRPAHLSLPARCSSSSAPAGSTSSSRSSAAARPPASPTRGPGRCTPSPTGAPDSRKVADRMPRASPATESRAQSPGGRGAGGRDGDGAGPAALTVLRHVRQECPGQPPRAARLGPGLRQHHLDLRVVLGARGLAGLGRARHLGHGHLQRLVLGLGRGTGLARELRPGTGGGAGGGKGRPGGGARARREEVERGSRSPTVEAAGGTARPGGGRGAITKARKSRSSRARYCARSKAGPWVSDTMAPARERRAQRRAGATGCPAASAGPSGGAHRRGRSTAPRAGARRGRRPGGSGRPWAAAGPRRSTAAPGGGRRLGTAGAARGGPDPAPGSPARGPHLRVAADAARRGGAGLGAHAQRARPVKAQAAGAGRQKDGQVLVSRELLRGQVTAESARGSDSG